MERRQHNSGKQKPGFAFRMGQGAGDGVFEYFGQRRKRGAQYRSHEPEIPKQSCFNHGIDFSIKAHGAVIHHAKDGERISRSWVCMTLLAMAKVAEPSLARLSPKPG